MSEEKRKFIPINSYARNEIQRSSWRLQRSDTHTEWLVGVIRLCGWACILFFAGFLLVLIWKAFSTLDQVNFRHIGALLVNTLQMSLIALGMALPFAIATSIWAVEWAPRWLSRMLNTWFSLLSCIPGSVIGLLLYVWIGRIFMLMWTQLGVILGLALMAYPILTVGCMNELYKKNVLRTASHQMGADSIQTAFIVVLPPTLRSIISLIIWVFGRLCGETAALFALMGMGLGYANSMFASAETLGMHILRLSIENQTSGEAFMSALVLTVVMLCCLLASCLILRSKEEMDGAQSTTCTARRGIGLL